LRICYIADGISIHTQRWACYFARKGHEVHVISNRFPPDYKGYDRNIELLHLTTLFPRLGVIARYSSFPLWIFQVRRLIREIHPNIVNAHFITVYGYLGAFSGFHPLVLTAWGSDILITPKNNPIHRIVTSRALKRADRIICVSPMLKEETIRLGARPQIIEVTPIGIDTQRFSPQTRNKAMIERLGITDEPVVISTRTLAPVYDVETLIKAIPYVLNEVKNAKFIVAGDGKQRTFLENLARTLGVSGDVRFTGWIPNADLPAFLASSDVYVSTSHSDGTSISLLEALACGLAPVVTDIPANRPWVKDDETGYLVPVGDYKKLASMIVRLLRDGEARARFARAARDIVLAAADYNKEMTKIAELYESSKPPSS
jgi:glycosyltransferase involved in cell wall biosynthesis